MNRRAITLATAGHLATDLHQGMVPAMLPFFVAERHFSYAQAAGLVFAANIISSLVQPLFGQFADRRNANWLMPLGIVVAATGVALTGELANYWLVLLSLAISGIGIAAFHPVAARVVNQAAGERRATSLSFFSLGGTLGFAIGPIVATAIILPLGLHGSWLLAIPGFLAAAVLTTQLPILSGKVAGKQATKVETLKPEPPAAEWGPFSRLTGAVMFRSVIFYGLNTFLPLYWVNVLHQDKGAGGTALTILLFASAAGTLLGGWLADRYNRRWLIVGGMLAMTPVLFIFVGVNQVALATLLLLPLGIMMSIPSSSLVVLGQDYLPGRVGMASGVTLGLAMTVGGIAAPVLGGVADLSGVQTALLGLVAMPLLAAALAYTLPTPGRKRQAARVTAPASAIATKQAG